MNKKLILSTILGILINPAMSMNSIDDNAQNINNSIINTNNVIVKNNINLNNTNVVSEELKQFEIKFKNYFETMDRIESLIKESKKKIKNKEAIEKSIKNRIQNAKIQEKFINMAKNLNKNKLIEGRNKLIKKIKQYKKTTIEQYKNKISESFKKYPGYKIIFLDRSSNKITNNKTSLKDVGIIKYSIDCFDDFKNPFIHIENKYAALNIENILLARSKCIDIFQKNSLKLPKYFIIFNFDFNFNFDLSIGNTLKNKEIVANFLQNLDYDHEYYIQQLQQSGQKYENFPICVTLCRDLIFESPERIDLLDELKIAKLRAQLNKSIKELKGL